MQPSSRQPPKRTNYPVATLLWFHLCSLHLAWKCGCYINSAGSSHASQLPGSPPISQKASSITREYASASQLCKEKKRERATVGATRILLPVTFQIKMQWNVEKHLKRLGKLPTSHELKELRKCSISELGSMHTVAYTVIPSSQTPSASMRGYLQPCKCPFGNASLPFLLCSTEVF